MAPQLRIFVPPHPLIRHWLGIARDHQTPTPLFRTAIAELGRWLAYEAVREWLPTVSATVLTPLAETPAEFVDFSQPLAIVPVLRAGLGLVDSVQQVLPTARIFHLGLERDEATLDPRCYLNRLPEQFDANTRVLVLEPMLATGGSLLYVLDQLSDRGIPADQIRVLSIVAAPPALQKLSQRYPALTIYSAIIDEQLNDRGFIVPGLGDAGDRLFGT
ncbi:uracil phosphoribosyltransferase [Synechococcus elongatus]|uniref:Uracil phosphoribosyltransferase n=1 Tax=Synechococcus elongatus PCC 11801 TaxID=2219813 RepID=A0AAN1QQW3_SYNEL|nr:uracil phosphoribosyltransferase [Synechococcus elongatus]AZB73685.1 uracil phosphoribosyltransferase [Synechococcus elongatus PCC 11801]